MIVECFNYVFVVFDVCFYCVYDVFVVILVFSVIVSELGLEDLALLASSAAPSSPQ